MVDLDRWVLKRSQQLQAEIETAYEQYNFHVIYQKIHNFCAVDLGSFYLDVIKDRQYTTAKDSVARRSCQTAMYHIVHALTRWLAPILSYTADEIWQFIPGKKEASVFLTTWYRAWPAIDGVDMAAWQQLQSVRDEVNKALELERQQGHIGSALAANVQLYAKGALLPALQALGQELRFLLITSGASVQTLPSPIPPGAFYNAELELAIQVVPNTSVKCARCWHRCEDIGQDVNHPELCGRCVGNISGHAEPRSHA